MPKLILSSGDMVVDQCWIDGGRITIGRAQGHRIAIDDPSVAESHCSISAVGHDYILEDMRGMTLDVNGEPLRRRILQHNDVVRLGAFTLRYVDSKQSSEIDLERTMLIPGLKLFPDKRPDDSEMTRNMHVPSSRGSSSKFPLGHVKFTSGAFAGKTRVLDRVVATFGEPGRGVVVLTRRPKGYYAAHVEGDVARVNGEPIGKDPRLLRPGDRVEVAGTALEFALDQPG